MPVAPAARDRGAGDTEAVVRAFQNIFFGHGGPKTGPASTGIKFGTGIKQSGVATDTAKDTFRMFVWVFVGIGALGACMARDFKGSRGELLFPLAFRFDDAIDGDGGFADAGIAKFDDGYGLGKVAGCGFGLERGSAPSIPPGETDGCSAGTDEEEATGNGAGGGAHFGWGLEHFPILSSVREARKQRVTGNLRWREPNALPGFGNYFRRPWTRVVSISLALDSGMKRSKTPRSAMMMMSWFVTSIVPLMGLLMKPIFAVREKFIVEPCQLVCGSTNLTGNALDC
jgi:hypothetical protein